MRLNRKMIGDCFEQSMKQSNKENIELFQKVKYLLDSKSISSEEIASCLNIDLYSLTMMIQSNVPLDFTISQKYIIDNLYYLGSSNSKVGENGYIPQENRKKETFYTGEELRLTQMLMSEIKKDENLKNIILKSIR